MSDATADRLAALMVEAIRADHWRGDIDLGRVTSFAELHDECDANVYLLEARESIGLAGYDPAAVAVDSAALNTVDRWLSSPRRKIPYRSRDDLATDATTRAVRYGLDA